MTARMLGAICALALAAGGAPARSESEALDAHTHHPMRTIVLDNEHVQPSTLNMAPGDALVFENHALHAIEVTFTEPENVREKIRCGLVRPKAETEGQAPWLLFGWADGKLRATIPPGRFASVCSLQPGSYAYLAVAKTAAVREQGSGGGTPEKGQILVK